MNLTEEEKIQRRKRQRAEASKRYIEKNKEAYLAYLKTYREKKKREKQKKEFLEKYQEVTNQNPSEDFVKLCDEKF